MRNTFTTKNFYRRSQNCGILCLFFKSISAFFQKLNPFKKRDEFENNFYENRQTSRFDGISRYNNFPNRSENFNQNFRSNQSNSNSNKPKKFNKKKFFIKLAKIFGILFAIGLLVIIGVFIYHAQDLPDPSKINARNIDESTKIYDRTGSIILYDIHGEEKRTLIPATEIPDVMKKAIISLEDNNFYNHYGFDPRGLARAVLSNVFGIGQSVGGSTITQQFVKNSILTNEKKISRKIKELILAVEIESKFSKDEIIGMYLNEISFGANAYGIESASQTYFNKHAKDLTLDEATLLASIPKSPTTFSPFGTNLERLKVRQEYALDQMVKLKYISQQEADDAKKVDVFSKISKKKADIKAPHFVFYVQDELKKMGYDDEKLQKNGFKVYTTLDYEKHKKSEEIIKEVAIQNAEKYKANNEALVAIDPKNGDILTMIGSKDYFGQSSPEGCISGKNCKFEGNFNVATADRQPGSSFKPYAYLKAFEKGYTPETIVFDVETSFTNGSGDKKDDKDNENDEKDYRPKNYDGTFRGPVKLKEALAMSLNIPAVKVLYLAGPKDTISLAKRLGISSLNDPDRYGLSVVLGGGEVKLLDHTSAYSVLANGGVKFEKRSILKIEDKNGNIVYEAPKVEGERIIEEKYVTMLSHSLSHNKYRIPIFGENSPLKYEDNKVAVKTGTTNYNKDTWTMGYTPKIAIGVWGGNNDNSSMTEAGGGVSVTAPIFKRVLTEVFSDYLGDEFPKYDKDENKTGKDILDGELPEPDKMEVCEIKDDKWCKANKYCPEDKRKKRTFADIHNILYYVKKDDPRGDKPEKPKEDPQYKNWEDGVEEFYKKEKKMIFQEEPEDCKKEDFDKYEPKVQLSLPNSVSEKKISIKINLDSPYSLERIDYFADGDLIKSGKDKSFEYEIPDSKNKSDITFKVIITDSAGNTAEDSKSVKVDFP